MHSSIRWATGFRSTAYASRVPPIVPRNAPFETIRELLLVLGVTPELLLGEDAKEGRRKLALLTKEDVPLLVFMLGLYVFVLQRERRIGAITALMGAGWFLIATQVIQPHYHGLPTSPFFHRVIIFGPTIVDSARNVIREPALVWRWLRRPEIVGYLSGLLASAGYMSLFSPLVLGISAPVLAMNVFSTWDWTYSEGAHYSASIMAMVAKLTMSYHWSSPWRTAGARGSREMISGRMT